MAKCACQTGLLSTVVRESGGAQMLDIIEPKISGRSPNCGTVSDFDPWDDLPRGT